MPRKAKIVISDTHIGAGGVAEGNKLEDFISDVEFVVWLHELMLESNRDSIAMDLIINGDWIEFLQVPAIARFEPNKEYEAAAYNDVSEEAALKRLEIVYERHPGIFLALAAFLNASPPQRTLTILFGNHDPELAYPGVQARLAEMVGAVDEKVQVVAIGRRTYFEDGVYIEHGNAYTESVDQFQDSDSPFDPKDPDQVEHPSGSRFVTNFFNQIEWERPWIDGVHPVTALIFYAFAFDPALALRLLQHFLAVAPDVFLRPAAAPTPGHPGVSDQLLAQIEDPAQAEALAERMRTDPGFAAQYAAQVEWALVEKGAAPSAPPNFAGGPDNVSPLERGQALTEHFWHVLEEQAAAIAGKTGARVVLFGHIHIREDMPLANGARYLNTGTWIWGADFREAPDNLWQDLFAHPEKYSQARDLSYARIDFSEHGALTQVRLERAGAPPTPPAPPPEPQPQPGLWARLLLGVRAFFRRLFS